MRNAPLKLRQAAGTSVVLSLVVIAWVIASATGPVRPPALEPPAASDVTVHHVNGSRPNIVLILTDDQRWDTLWDMPNVQRELVAKGVKFTNGFVVNPVCCPSRASILTGEYSHSTGVWDNGGTYGGYDAFMREHGDASTLATWLDAAGYRTGLVGKYLNHYNDPSHTPPGWDEWAATLAQSEGKYYNYQLDLNGTPTTFGDAPQDYSTDVMANWAVNFIQTTPQNQPLFLYMATKSPHGSAVPAPRDLGTLQNYRVRHNPDFNEADVSDKPAYIRSLPPLTDQKIARLDHGVVLVDQALKSVDDAVGRIVSALRATGRLDNTMIVYTSDNGNLWGEHRWVAKSVPYEESIRVPIVVRYDPLVTQPGARSDAMALNIDFAPTFTQIAGVSAPGIEGRSLVPELRNPSLPGRQDFAVEHVQQIKQENLDTVPTYCAVRSRNSMFVQYATGEQEYYDLATDPWELRNVAQEPAYFARVVAAKQAASRLCNPLPPGFPPNLLQSPVPNSLASSPAPVAQSG